MSVKERMLKFIESQGIAISEFERNCGLSNGYVRQLKNSPSLNKLNCVLQAYPEINKEWLIEGDGEMIISEQMPVTTPKNTAVAKYIPIVHIDSVGGMDSPNSIIGDEYREGLLPVPDAQNGDIAIYQSGTSMAPAIPSGALLQIREVLEWRDYIGYGDVFVLLLKDWRRITKEIRRFEENPREYFWCVSYNPDVADEELPKRMIMRVWKVIRVLIDKGW